MRIIFPPGKIFFVDRVDDFLENCYTPAYQVRKYELRA